MKDRFSGFSSVTATVPVEIKTLNDTLTAISTYSEVVDKARKIKKDAPSKYKEFKKTLPAVSWAGVFSKRKKDSIMEFSDLIYFDIDNCRSDDKLKVTDNPFVAAAWTSLSGDGLGFIVRCNNLNKDTFVPTYNKLALEFEKKKLTIDRLSDVSRLNILSHDENIYINEEYNVFEAISPTEEIPKFRNVTIDLYSDIEDLIKFATYSCYKSGLYFTEGNYHNSCVKYFGFLIYKGVSETDAIIGLKKQGIDVTPHCEKTAKDMYKRYYR
jgi:hypothetical protein